MARIFIDGFEDGAGGLWTLTNSAVVSSSPPTGFSGLYYLNCSGNTNTATFTLPVSKSELYFAFKYQAASTGTAPNCIITFYDSALTAIAGLYRNFTTFLPEFRRGISSATLLGTGTTTISLNTTYLIEIYYKPLNSGGVFQVKINQGSAEIDYSGDTTGGLENIYRFGMVYVVSTTSCYGRIDDFVVDDANWIGNTKIQAIVPTGAGATNSWDCVVEQATFTHDATTQSFTGPLNLRQVIPSNELVTSRSSIRLRIKSPTDNAGIVIAGCSIGERSGSTDDFASAPTRVTFSGGENGITIPMGGEAISDSISFSLDETKDHIIHFYLTGTTVYAKGQSYGGGIYYYFQNAGSQDDTLVTTVTYTQGTTRVYYISGIQTVITDGSENHLAVDELPVSDKDYAYTNIGNAVDTYQMGNLAGSIASIKTVAVQSRNWREGNGTYDRGQHIVRPASTDRLAAAKTNVFPISPISFQSIWELNPEDSAAWEEADVNGMEAGIKAVEA